MDGLFLLKEMAPPFIISLRPYFGLNYFTPKFGPRNKGWGIIWPNNLSNKFPHGESLRHEIYCGYFLFA